MGTFKYRESVGAPWQELPVIGDIYTQDVRPETGGGGFSTETHETIMISKSSHNKTSRYVWQDWENYITNLDNIEILIVYYANQSFVYVRNITGVNDENNNLACIRSVYASSANTVEDAGDYIQFISGTGLQVMSGITGSYSSPPNYGAGIYCVMRKEAA